MQILLATSNAHKVDEVRAILAPLGIDLSHLGALAEPPAEPVEDGETFEANARLKAVGYARATGRRCLADDSGLEVDALGGEPGVYSARYARDQFAADEFEAMPRGERDRANNRKLLKSLAGVPLERRTARFVCALCLADPDGSIVHETRGTFAGVITDEPRGQNGFGYDPLLWLADSECTSAELSPEEKNARSHRGAAVRAMAEYLRARAGIGARPVD